MRGMLVCCCVQAPETGCSDYEAFGVKLTSLSTVAGADAPSLLLLFPALQSASTAAAAAAKVIRQLHVQGWSCYWKPRRQQQPQPHAAVSSSSQQQKQRHRQGHSGPRVEPEDYLLAPVQAVLQVTVHSNGASGGSGASSSSIGGSGSVGILSSGLACDVFLGAGQVSMQLSSQQLVGMARLADDAAVWSKRARYGCYRPPGWITVLQAARQGIAWPSDWHRARQQEQGGAGLSATAGQVPASSNGGSGSSTGSGHGLQACTGRRSPGAATVSGGLVPTGRHGVGAPVSWRAVWQYAVQSVLADVRDRRRQQGCWKMHSKDLLARRWGAAGAIVCLAVSGQIWQRWCCGRTNHDLVRLDLLASSSTVVASRGRSRTCEGSAVCTIQHCMDQIALHCG